MYLKALEAYSNFERLLTPKVFGPEQVLRDEALSHVRNMLAALRSAQRFQIDQEAADMMANLATDMGASAWDMFRTARLPFPVMWIEHSPAHAGGKSEGALVTHVERPDGTGRTTVHYVSETDRNFVPAIAAFHYAPEGATQGPTALGKMVLGEASKAQDTREVETGIKDYADKCFLYFGFATMMAELLNHRGMLERDDVPVASRAERRRAARSGEELLDTRISVIRLGEAGRGQLEAMRDDDPNRDKGTRRAHWVRGHFMRNRAGGISWRMPHIRGAGPVIRQERHVRAPEDPPPDHDAEESAPQP